MDSEAASATVLPFLRQARFADLLLTWRRASGQSQAEVAEAVGVRPQTVSAWERGTLKPQQRFHAKLATLLGLDGPRAVADLIRDGQPTVVTGLPDRGAEELTGAQLDVVRAVAAQVRSGRPLTPEDHELFKRLLGAVQL